MPDLRVGMGTIGRIVPRRVRRSDQMGSFQQFLGIRRPVKRKTLGVIRRHGMIRRQGTQGTSDLCF